MRLVFLLLLAELFLASFPAHSEASIHGDFLLPLGEVAHSFVDGFDLEGYGALFSLVYSGFVLGVLTDRLFLRIKKARQTSDSQQPESKSDPESGSVFTVLLAAIAMASALSIVLYQTMSGPVASMVRVTNKTAAKAQMQSVSSITIMSAVNQANNGDCEGDGYVVPPQWRVAGNPAAEPNGGGLIPLTLGAPLTDPWGTDYGYCVWEVGPVQTKCAASNGGIPENVLLGTTTPATGNAVSQTVLAIVSAGPDRKFSTSCRPYDSANPTQDLVFPTGTPGGSGAGGDDIVQRFTYKEASTAMSSIWILKVGSASTAEIAKDISVGPTLGTSKFSVSAATGAVTTSSSINATTDVIASNNIAAGNQGSIGSTTLGITKFRVVTGNPNDGLSVQQAQTAGQTVSANIFGNLTTGVGTLNPIIQTGDMGLIYEGTAIDSLKGFVIAPWSTTAGGIRLDSSGNVTVTGNLSVTGTMSTSSVPLSTLIGSVQPATTIDSGSNVLTWNWNALTTQTALTLASSSATSGTILNVTSSNAGVVASKALSVTNATTGAGYGLYSSMTGVNLGAALYGTSAATSASGYGLEGVLTANSAGAAVYGTMSNATNTGYGGYFVNGSATGWALRADGITYFNGSVGIGTNAPGAYKLNVNGNTNITGTATITGATTLSGFNTAGVVLNSAAGLLSSTAGPLPIANGGTNLSGYAVGDILYASGAAALSRLADVATGNTLMSGGVGAAPSWGKVDLTTHVTGRLPLANETQGVARSVLGVTGNATADRADIQGTADQTLVVNHAGTALTFGTLAVAGGGTGLTSGTQYGLPYFSTTTTMASTGAGTTTTVLHGNASGAPSWGSVALGTDVSGALQTAQFPALTGDVTTIAGSLATSIGSGKVTNSMLAGSIDLASKMTGTLPVANGGTGVTTSTGTGSVVLSTSPTFATAIYAPIMYDSNNNGYYVDPNGTSNFNSLNIANGSCISFDGGSCGGGNHWIGRGGAMGVSTLALYAPNGQGIEFGTNNQAKMTMDTNGNLSVNGNLWLGYMSDWLSNHVSSGGYVNQNVNNGSNPTFNSIWNGADLSVGGNIINYGNYLCTGRGWFTQVWDQVFSDARLKKDIRPLKGSLEKIEKLHGVTYKWRTPEERIIGKELKLDTAHSRMGLIAQEVEKVFPFAVEQPDRPTVKKDKDGNPMRDKKGNLILIHLPPVKILNSNAMIGALVEAIKELAKRGRVMAANVTGIVKHLTILEADNNRLHSELRNLESDNKELHKELDDMKARFAPAQ